jgi:hypothetical protein
MKVLFTWLIIASLVLITACNKENSPTAPGPVPAGPIIGLSGNLSFGTITVGTTASATMTIINNGNAELTVSSISYPTGFSGNWAGGTIASAASQPVTVTFAPGSASTFSGNITVTANHVSGANTIAVSGTGTAAPSFTLSGTVTETPPTTSTPLVGARVAFVDGANAGRFGIAGADGRYEVTGLSNGSYTVSVTLSGYTTATVPVTIDGNTTLNIRLDPISPRTSWGPGQYRVGVDIPAGRYYTDPSHGCRFQRVSNFSGESGSLLSDTQINFDARQWIVDLAAGDFGFSTDGSCGFWFTTPRHGLQTTINAGTWIVGTQITAGTYRAENSTVGCEWQRLSSFSGTGGAVIAGAFANTAGPQLVTILSTDAGFMTNPACGTWTQSAAAGTATR